MSVDIFIFFFGYALLFLGLWAFPKLRKFLQGHKSEILFFTSGYIFLLADIKAANTSKLAFGFSWEDCNTAIVVLGVIMGASGILWSGYEKYKQKSLKEVTEDLSLANATIDSVKSEYFKLCSDSIKHVFEPFFKTDNVAGRVSLYKHQNSEFVLLGRHADSPAHKNSSKASYPDNEGFIAKGWEDRGEFSICGAPEWKNTGNGTSYRAFMRLNCTISEDRLDQLIMRSRSFFVYRFDNSDSDKPAGIIVLEQTSPAEIDKEMIHDIFQRHEKIISSLLKSMRSLSRLAS
jgi:hypothetical protein